MDQPCKRINGVIETVCPRCGCKSFYDMTPIVAWCYPSGLIAFGTQLPPEENRVWAEIGRGPAYSFRPFIEAKARRGYGEDAFEHIVPGMSEAEGLHDKHAAFSRWIASIKPRRPRDGITVKEPQPFVNAN